MDCRIRTHAYLGLSSPSLIEARTHPGTWQGVAPNYLGLSSPSLIEAGAQTGLAEYSLAYLGLSRGLNNIRAYRKTN